MYISTDYNKSLPEQAKQALDQVYQSLIDHYEAEIKTLKARADDVIPKINNNIENCSQFGNYKNPENREKRDGYYLYGDYVKSVEEIEKECLLELDIGHNKIEEVHKSNLPALENNKLVYTKIKALMQSIGVPDSYQERDYSSRSYKPKYKTVYGYGVDLGKIKLSDGYETALDKEKRLRKELIEYVNKRKDKELKEKREKEATELKQKKFIQLGVMAVKYGLAENISGEDLLNEILAKDKYLNLGHYLMMNRNDWSDAYNYAEIGLRNFVVETEEDKKIYEEINSYIINWQGDGRVFRDAGYGYDYLFKKVNQDLYKDYVKIYELIQ